MEIITTKAMGPQIIMILLKPMTKRLKPGAF